MRALVATAIVWVSALSTLHDAHADDEKQRACLVDSENAQRFRNAGKLGSAREAFLRCARPECPAVVRADCEASLAEVDASASTVIVIARDGQGRDLQNVRVFVDNVLVTNRLDGRAISVDPGAHTLRYELDGVPSFEEQIVTHEGEKRRLIEVRFQTTTNPELPKTSGPPTLAYVFAGISVVTLGVGGYFGLNALSDYHAMEDRCGATRACPDSEATTVRTQAIVADVSLAIGLVSAGLATWFFLKRPSTPVATSAAR